MTMPTFEARTAAEIQKEIEVLGIYKAPAMIAAPFVVAVRNRRNPMMVERQSGFARLVRDDDGRIVGVQIVASPLNAHRFTRREATEIATWEPSFFAAGFAESCEQRQADLIAN